MQGILFDLDGTLLDIDIDRFLGRYFEALSGVMSTLSTNAEQHAKAMEAVMSATGAMMKSHAGVTNRVVFHDAFLEATGIDLDEKQSVLDEFYADVFPTLRDGLGPMPGARQAIDTARECGLKVAIATNPIFPRAAIEHRLAWAGIAPSDVDFITSYENMHATKPHALYFRETADAIGCDPGACIMVGDDRVLDLPAADIGMRTFYVGSSADAAADYRGDLTALSELLLRSCGD